MLLLSLLLVLLLLLLAPHDPFCAIITGTTSIFPLHAPFWLLLTILLLCLLFMALRLLLFFLTPLLLLLPLLLLCLLFMTHLATIITDTTATTTDATPPLYGHA